MKVKDLIKQLEQYEDFEIEATYNKIDGTKSGYAALSYTCYAVEDVADIGHSSKVVVLGLKEN